VFSLPLETFSSLLAEDPFSVPLETFSSLLAEDPFSVPLETFSSLVEDELSSLSVVADHTTRVESPQVILTPAFPDVLTVSFTWQVPCSVSSS
jgi:hypothetical protein